jgi:hypothetical protein
VNWRDETYAASRMSLLQKFLVQVSPSGIALLDQAEFPLPVPFLQAFLSPDGRLYVAEDLMVHKHVDMVAFCETGDFGRPVLSRPAEKIVRYTNVRSSIPLAGQNVNVVRIHPPRPWTPAFAGVTRPGGGAVITSRTDFTVVISAIQPAANLLRLLPVPAGDDDLILPGLFIDDHEITCACDLTSESPGISWNKISCHRQLQNCIERTDQCLSCCCHHSSYR